MKTIILALSLVFLTSEAARAQGVKIAVVDMRQALTDYHKTKTEVESINQLGDEKIRNIDERKAAYQKMTSQMVELDKTMRAVELSEDKRQDAAAKLEVLARDRMAKANEIGDAERKAAQELMEARQNMEDRLIAEIQAVVRELGQAKGIDLIFDKSFLPKASKAIVFTSPNVTDLTNEVIAKLNAGAPGGN